MRHEYAGGRAANLYAPSASATSGDFEMRLAPNQANQVAPAASRGTAEDTAQPARRPPISRIGGTPRFSCAGSIVSGPIYGHIKPTMSTTTAGSVAAAADMHIVEPAGLQIVKRSEQLPSRDELIVGDIRGRSRFTARRAWYTMLLPVCIAADPRSKGELQPDSPAGRSPEKGHISLSRPRRGPAGKAPPRLRGPAVYQSWPAAPIGLDMRHAPVSSVTSTMAANPVSNVFRAPYRHFRQIALDKVV